MMLVRLGPKITGARIMTRQEKYYLYLKPYASGLIHFSFRIASYQNMNYHSLFFVIGVKFIII
jgi:hypothetical protein